MTETLVHYINGKAAKGASTRTSPVFNPATGAVAKNVALASVADVDTAVKAATAAYPAWRDTSQANKQAILYKCQMFALGIIDKLTPGELNGGAAVAGTGTIDAEGTVGAIGGIRQKMFGAERAGATWFLAPAKNCDEVVGHVPEGLTVIPVSTLKDSLAALKVIESGGSTASLPTCSTR